MWDLDSGQQVNIRIKWTFGYSHKLSHTGALKHVVDYEEGGGTESRILDEGEEDEEERDVVKL